MRTPLFTVLIGISIVVGGLTPFGTVRAQIEELPRPKTADDASFGVSVALGDSIAAVGASAESVCGPNAGAVYIFRRAGGPQFASWTFEARLTPQNCRSNSFFGDHIALSGRRLLVSSSSEHFANEGSNAVIVFERQGTGTWSQTARLTPGADRREGLFAADVDLDGDRAVVSTSGSPETGAGGAVYVYEYDGESDAWNRTARLTADSERRRRILGGTVTLDGNRIAVAASTYFERKPGAVYVFQRDPARGRWRRDAVVGGIEAFFIDLDLSGPRLIVGESRAGASGAGQAGIYTRFSNPRWTREATLDPSIPYASGSFGDAVSLEGDWALVSGYDEQLGMEINIDRVVYVFRRTDGAWRQRTILDVGQVDFGAAFEQHGTTVLVSSVPANQPGTVYVIQLL